LVTERLSIFVQTDVHAEVEQYGASWAIRFPPSNDSRELAGYAGKCLDKIYRPEHRYKKAGVLLFDLCKREMAQPMMFDDRDVERANRLMVAMDRINRDFGRGTLRIASSSALSLNAGRTWHLRSDHRSGSRIRSMRSRHRIGTMRHHLGYGTDSSITIRDDGCRITHVPAANRRA
jgi:DNA polymerase V